jgi:histidinol-phosphate aminotransferase
VSWVNQVARADIVALKPYEHAVWEPSVTRLHANELPWRTLGDDSASGFNRYPEPQPPDLIDRLAALYSVPPASVLVTRGSDDAIDLLVRGFCRAEHDAILVCPPTFGMYAVAAQIQGAQVLAVPLLAGSDFALDESAVLKRIERHVKMVFLCSPNNPTGNLLSPHAILRIASALSGRSVVVVDEAYIEFSGQDSLTRHVARLSNLAVLRTLSKAHGLAGARCGTLIADPEVLQLLRKVLPPYALAQPTVDAALKSATPEALASCALYVQAICRERARMQQALMKLSHVVRVLPSAANFLLTQFRDAAEALTRAHHAGLLVRDVRGPPELEGCLRITIGTPQQNERLLRAWS